MLYLRSVKDSDVLRERLDRGGTVVVVGAGWIGAEVAASARQRGLEVTVIDPECGPLGARAGPRGRRRLPRHPRRPRGADADGYRRRRHSRETRRVERVRTSDGRELECDFVVVGVGVQPRTELAARAGIAGRMMGSSSTSTCRPSGPGVFAAGDVARAHHPFYGQGIRVEHWSNALNQGPAAARNMLGHADAYDRVPYFFSDQYDVGMEYSGFAHTWDRVVFRGDPASGEFIAFWLTGDHVVAGMNVNVWDVTDPIQRLIRERVAVEDRRLADPDVALEELAPVEEGSAT